MMKTWKVIRETIVKSVLLNLGNTKLGNAVFMGIISAEFLYGIDLLINRKKDRAV